MADQKLTALTALTALTGDDLLYVVDDAAGTPASRKVTAAVVRNYTSQNYIPGGRLTLVSGTPIYTAANSVAVSGQDTSADTITVTAHGWIAGTAVVSSSTSGGITAWVLYYVGSVTTNTVSLHTTAAAALAGTSKLDITGAVSATIRAIGVAGDDIYYTPFVHNVINLWDGMNWAPTEFSETTLTLSALTSGKPYDVFGYLSGGVLALESLVWTDDTTRATAVTLQDGRYCKSGDKTRLLLGSFYTTSTTTTEDSSMNRYLSNVYNAVDRHLNYVTGDSGHTYTSTTIRAYNSSTLARVNFLVSVAASFRAVFGGVIAASVAGSQGDLLAGFDSTTTQSFDFTSCTNANTQSVRGALGGSSVADAGKHYLQLLERSNATNAVTFSFGALTGSVSC